MGADEAAAPDGALAALAPGAAEEVVPRVLSVLVPDADPLVVFAVDEVAIAVGEVAVGELAVMGAAAVAFVAVVEAAVVGAVCPGTVALGVAPGGKGVAPVKGADGVVPDVDGAVVAPGCCSVCAPAVSTATAKLSPRLQKRFTHLMPLVTACLSRSFNARRTALTFRDPALAPAA